MKIFLCLLMVLTFWGCRKTVKPDPVIEAAMQASVTCVKCRHTDKRVSFKRVNQILVQCPKCQKIFSTLKKRSER